MMPQVGFLGDLSRRNAHCALRFRLLKLDIHLLALSCTQPGQSGPTSRSNKLHHLLLAVPQLGNVDLVGQAMVVPRVQAPPRAASSNRLREMKTSCTSLSKPAKWSAPSKLFS
jgi:hypothetical protein